MQLFGNTQTNVLLLAACVVVATVTTSAHADLLAYDPIDGYDTGNPMGGTFHTGQAAGGFGFGTVAEPGWGINNVGSGNFHNAVAGGLSFGDLLVSGNQHIEQNEINGYLRTALTNPINSGTVYVSMLGRAPTTGSGGLDWGPALTVNFENVDAAHFLPHDGEVHFIVMRFDLGNPGTAGDSATIYVDADPAAAEPGGGTVVDLGADAQWNGTLSHLVGRGGYDLHWDELRVGETWADVTPIIPEPASFALLSLGGLLMLRRRRA